MASLSVLELMIRIHFATVVPCKGQKYDYVQNTSYMVLVLELAFIRYGSDPHYP